MLNSNRILCILFVLLITTSLIACGAGGSAANTSSNTISNGGGANTAVATLTWDAPTTRTDGSSLNPATDLSAYKLYYGTATHNYTNSVNVANPGTSGVITDSFNLPHGTYYFVVTAVDVYGQESAPSVQISMVI